MRNRFESDACLVQMHLSRMEILFSLIGEEVTRLVVLLRMNVEFMEFMRAHYYVILIAQESWKMAIEV